MAQRQETHLTKPQATNPVCNRNGIVFDFDDTLAANTLDELVKAVGLDVEQFHQQQYAPLKNAGWDHVAARFYCLIQASKHHPEIQHKITKDYLIQFGQQLQPFDGVTEMFDRLRRRVQDLNPQIELEFYMITGGFGKVVRNTCIAPYFNQIWGCEFHYSETGEIDFLKRSISHTEKTRYLMQIASGQDQVDGNGRSLAYRDVSEDQLHIPLSQMIYVGDGTSDVPCFSVLNDEGGIAIDVYKEAQAWDEQIQVSESQQVTNLAEADYREDSELMRSLTLAVESLCKQISLRQLSVGE
ncbi:haloacid dehalogenase-like hydrolase [Phormidium sp. FACHB-592]|uniref:Haloacid dehalogenase-like hydrolase n=1 Tax=Stenomitos frigidus AS-A4 TaxID=2933935 RepID=A0ABV0KSZ9_9CYAN|nr:haloacid dehalogenase-like hydrolase [Phormidium sp. FACHB-592]MBD2075010.1 haloacid dehalogenase-like hydrolase [Phormidium sp. FACHB-592]